MLPLYQSLQPYSSPCICESKKSYISITERHVQAIWLEQKYFKHLKTIDEHEIEVISPGIWNAEAGPDFLKAHIKINGQAFIGDIEIHLYAEGWLQHRHHENERYNHVILHISLWKSKIGQMLVKENGEPLCTAYLEPCLTIPMGRLLQLIDIDLYPYKKTLGAGKCSQKLFKKISKEKTVHLLMSASYWRLEQKNHDLQHRVLHPSHQLPAGIAKALGYKQNAEAFLELFLFLLEYRDLPADELFAITLGCCGFFDRKIPVQWSKSDYYQRLKISWESKKDQITLQVQIKLNQIRPSNHPVRRLAYLIKLLQDPQMERRGSTIYQVWTKYMNGTELGSKDISLLRKEILDLIPSYSDDYWNHHYTFETSSKKAYLSLIGEDLKFEILINTILPMLYYEVKHKGNFTDLQLFQNFYQTIRPSSSGKSKYLNQRFFKGTPNEDVMQTRQLEQGAYQLHKDFCTYFEASCEGCPFVERYLGRV